MIEKPERAKRPPGVTITGWLHLVQALLLLLFGGYLLRVSGLLMTPDGALDLDPFRLLQEAGTGGALVVLSLPALIVALGLFWLRSWAWLLAMVMQGLGLASALIAYLVGRPNYLLMALGILIVWYLHQPEVRKVFQARAKINV